MGHSPFHSVPLESETVVLGQEQSIGESWTVVHAVIEVHLVALTLMANFFFLKGNN